MARPDVKKRDGRGAAFVIFGPETNFNGFLKFRDTLCIRGKFRGTIEATGALIVDKGAEVEADHISVSSLVVYGTVNAAVQAMDKVDMMSGAVLRGDVSAARLRIADGVTFEGQCSMTGLDREVEIFSRTREEIQAELSAPREKAAPSGEPFSGEHRE
ncbi:MAG: polymer-forming cytoskeletal protein [Treponema sp.]|jgi:cytoskeletal protein CcmA (bactofilin family)|nr:polymer-forming cytoskeletal protein [Treponema sp.]